MNVKKILLISLIALAILASVSAVSAGLFDGLFSEGQQDNIIEIDHISFNTTNVTKFTKNNQSNSELGYNKWYMDENRTGYNVHIFNLSKGFKNYDELRWDDVLKAYKGDNFDNVPSQTVNGIVVYTITANVGDHVGEPRYKSYVENRDAKCIVDFVTPDPNETAKMALSLKFN